jgi:hypothetical protein
MMDELDALEEDYREEILAIIALILLGVLTRAAARAELERAARRNLAMLYALGGSDPTSAKGAAFIAAQATIHKRSAAGLVKDVFGGKYLSKEAGAALAASRAALLALPVREAFAAIARVIQEAGEQLGGLVSRAQLWANKGVAAYTQGQLDAPIPAGQPEPRYMWRLGNTEQHCADCLLFDGKVLLQSEWARLPAPQSLDLECGGWHCDCRLEPTDAARTGIPEIGL